MELLSTTKVGVNQHRFRNHAMDVLQLTNNPFLQGSSVISRSFYIDLACQTLLNMSNLLLLSHQWQSEIHLTTGT
jgi:hypothetical protein